MRYTVTRIGTCCVDEELTGKSSQPPCLIVNEEQSEPPAELITNHQTEPQENSPEGVKAQVVSADKTPEDPGSNDMLSAQKINNSWCCVS